MQTTTHMHYAGLTTENMTRKFVLLIPFIILQKYSNMLVPVLEQNYKIE